MLVNACIVLHMTNRLFKQARTSLEERNASLNENLVRVREELRSVESRKTTLEQELRHAQNELTDMSKKCSVAEASLEVSSRV